jgi:hypothetical protein
MRSNHEVNASEDFCELLGMVWQMLASVLAGPSFGNTCGSVAVVGYPHDGCTASELVGGELLCRF